jgi:hypothetical protein
VRFASKAVEGTLNETGCSSYNPNICLNYYYRRLTAKEVKKSVPMYSKSKRNIGHIISNVDK